MRKYFYTYIHIYTKARARNLKMLNIERYIINYLVKEKNTLKKNLPGEMKDY